MCSNMKATAAGTLSAPMDTRSCVACLVHTSSRGKGPCAQNVED